MAGQRYDLVVVGTGFAGTFFLHEYLRHAARDARVLVLERGGNVSHAQRVENRATLEDEEQRSYVNRPSTPKVWRFNFGFGGTSNGWWACTPRMLPSDFEMQTRYGVGRDWPVDYDTLEEYYCRAEELMEVAGPDDGSPFPRSRPYPLPPHHLSDPDRLLKQAFPDSFFAQPTARPTLNLAGRPVCCAAGVCHLCPIDSKFTVLNAMSDVYEDARVELKFEARVTAVETRNDVATAVAYRDGERDARVEGELIVLGANALFNPHLLLSSGLDGPEVGRGLVEQASVRIFVFLDGLDNFQGSTSITGHGYNLYDGPHRADRGGALLETWNIPQLRDERGKWRQVLTIKAIVEDLRQPANHVALSDDPAMPVAVFAGLSDYAKRGLRALDREIRKVVEPLPVEQIHIHDRLEVTESHIMGTTVMGNDPKTSVVDRHGVHHRVRNLVLLGSSLFPTAAPANPTLTLAAHALWSASELVGRAS